MATIHIYNAQAKGYTNATLPAAHMRRVREAAALDGALGGLRVQLGGRAVIVIDEDDWAQIIPQTSRTNGSLNAAAH